MMFFIFALQCLDSDSDMDSCYAGDVPADFMSFEELMELNMAIWI